MTDWNFADVWEAVAETVPDGLSAIHGERRLTWSDTERRANGVAQFLLDLGVVHQDKVAHYLYNGPEYMESTFAILKAGLVPVNTNYRYTDDELVYLWDNADAVAVLFHGSVLRPHRRAAVAGTAGPGLAVGRRRHRPVPVLGDPLRARRRERARRGPPRHGRAPATTSTSSTPAAPRGCPRVSCGARTTCSPGSTPATSCACPRTGASTASARPSSGTGPLPPPGLPPHARHGRLHRHGGHVRGRVRRHPHRSPVRPRRAARHRRPRQRQHRRHRRRRLRQTHPARPRRAPRSVAAVDVARLRVLGRHVERGDQGGPARAITPT